MRRSVTIALAITLLFVSGARAEEPHIVLRDRGSLAAPFADARDLASAAEALLRAYLATGAEVPEVMSVWTTFPMGGVPLSTRFVPVGNDVRGIGLEAVYGGDGTFESALPPLKGMLLHNDFHDLPRFAERHEAPLEGYAEYLFLLELSHLFGPAASVPGADPNALLGFPFHWSFFMNAGGSPAGGNRWLAEGDGTFTTAPLAPGSLRFSMLDLYLMGLAREEEVPPFGLLMDVEVLTDQVDPVNGGRPLSAVTFPWFSPEPVRVRAHERSLSIADIIEANGPREPAFGQASAELTLGTVLVVAEDATDAEVEDDCRDFAPIARRLAPAFHEATATRGTLRVVTESPSLAPAEPDAGPAPDAGAPDAGTPTGDASVPSTPADGGRPTPPSGSGCSVAPGTATSSTWLLALILMAGAGRRRRAVIVRTD